MRKEFEGVGKGGITEVRVNAMSSRRGRNTSTEIKFRAFCLFVTTGYPFSLEGGILNVESVPSASGE